MKDAEQSGALPPGKNENAFARAPLDVLEDIRSAGREARDDGDLKTALKAYELEGKHLGMFKEKVEVSGAVDLCAALEEARQRVAKLR